MSSEPLPLFVKLEGIACLVIGGEGEAVYKTKLLMESGAEVTLVATQVDKAIAHWAETGKINWLCQPFCMDHMEGQWLVVCVSEDAAFNAALAREAERRRIFLNIIDKPDYCGFIWPAIVRRSPVTAAISTGGASPALAGYLRRWFQKKLPDNLGEMALWLSLRRKETAKHFASLKERARFWRDLFDQGMAERYFKGDREGAERMITHALEQHRARQKQESENPGSNQDIPKNIRARDAGPID